VADQDLGTVPAAFRALARQQISRYPTVHMENATVTSIAGNASTKFTIQTTDGQSFTASKVVIATGMKDVMPSTPGIAENWGKGIYWCPWCDGYEHRDQPYGIIGSYADVLDSVFEVHTLESDIIAFVNGTQTAETIAKVNSNPPTGYGDWEKKLQKYNIKIENRTMASVTRLQDGSVVQSPDGMSEYDKFLVTFTDGTTIERGAFIANFPSVQRSALGASLGIPYDAKQHLKTDGRMESIMPGVFVVGDANADNSTNVPHAMWSGKRAAVQIHVALEQERSDEMIRKRSTISEDEVSRMMGRDLLDIYNRLEW
jgi:thioredoxin reductase